MLDADLGSSSRFLIRDLDCCLLAYMYKYTIVLQEMQLFSTAFHPASGSADMPYQDQYLYHISVPLRRERCITTP